MTTPLNQKSTIQEIQSRFDQDVDRFANLDTGQAAIIDAPLAMELITQAALASHSQINHVLDVGCGAGNNSLKLRLEAGYDFEIDLVDLSEPMLNRAQARLQEQNSAQIRCLQTDIRQAQLPDDHYDIVIAAAVLHHLRAEQDWLDTFQLIYNCVAPGGSFWITDMVSHESKSIQNLMWQRYGKYLEDQGGAAYRDQVFEYIDREDSPRSVPFQLELMRKTGFEKVDLLHKNSCFAAFGGIKPAC